MNCCICALLFLFTLGLNAETAEGVFSGETAGPAQPVWRAALGGAVTGVPTVQAGSVAVVADGGRVKAFSLSGKSLWEYYARGKLAPYITRSREGTSYVYREDGFLIAINRAGRELWRVRPEIGETRKGRETLSSPIVSGWDGRIFVPSGRKMYCYTASGYKLWSAELDHTPVVGPLLDKSGGLVMALENGDLAEISPFGGVWTIVLGEVPPAMVPMDGGTLILHKNGRPRFYRNIQKPGREDRYRLVPVLESLPDLGGIPAGGAARGNRAAVLLSNGRLVQFSLTDGKLEWSGETHVRGGELQGKNRVEMIYDERGIYVFSQGGASGFSSSGQRLWLFRIRGAASLPALSDEGILYSGGADWLLYAYRLEERILRRRYTLYGPLPDGNYGLADPRPSPWAGFAFHYEAEALAERLGEIARKIGSGTVAEDEAAYTAYLMEVSGCMLNPSASPTHPLAHARERAEAARLLGYLGSRETIAFLSALFTGDPDPSVKSAAAAAIGRIGVDPDGTALRAFSAAASARFKDEQVLTAAAAAAGSLCRFSGPPLSDSGIKLLAALGGSGMPPKIREQARKELAELSP